MGIEIIPINKICARPEESLLVRADD